ncbi:unnamed protein product [Effrenium voratum]|nr:unnamed protein product [Effrenium voratum]
MECALHQLAALMGFQVKMITLRLQDQWPAKRDRWWAILAPSTFDLEEFLPWAKDYAFDSINHIIPDWPFWPREDEVQLALSDVELGHFHDPELGPDERVLEAPRYLHVKEAALLLTIPQSDRGYFGPYQLRRIEDTFEANGIGGTGLNNVHIQQEMQRIAHLHGELNGEPLHIMDPTVCTRIASNDVGPDFIPQSALPALDACLFAIFAYNGHWALLECICFGGGFVACVYDGIPGHARPGALALVRFLGVAWNLQCWNFGEMSILAQDDPHTCGTIALFHLSWRLDLTMYQPIALAHQLILEGSQDRTCQIIASGPTSAEERVIASLVPLLVEKGVPADRAAERAQQAIHKIGLGDLRQALESKQVWASLKAIGSRPSINFMFLKHDELMEKVRLKGESKYGLQISTSAKRKGQQVRQAVHPVPQVCPGDLELLPGSFLAEDGTQVGTLAISKVTKGQNGVAFASIMDASPYLRDGTPLNHGPLAILTTSCVPHELTGMLPVDDLIFPAQHLRTQEAVLIHGSLIQLGQVRVNKEVRKNSPNLAPVPTSTLKILVHRDQWPQDWTAFTSSPLKATMQQQPILTLCRVSGCGDTCPRFHAPVDDDEELNTVIMDVWSRQWIDSQGQRVNSDVADIWSAFVRVPHSALSVVLASSGSFGIYIDPRTESGKAPSPDYGVVWVPGGSYTDAVHKLKTTDAAISLARFRGRYGIRFAQTSLAAGHEQLKPDVRANKPEADSKPLIASTKTQQYLRSQNQACASAHDLWMSGSDPWAKWSTPAASTSASTFAPDKLQQVEERLRSDIKSSIQQHLNKQAAGTDMDLDDQDAGVNELRFQQLEADVAELNSRKLPLRSLINKQRLTISGTPSTSRA